MHKSYLKYRYPYYEDMPQYEDDLMFDDDNYDYYDYIPRFDEELELKDYGPEPFAIDINKATIQNENFRTALWTGEHLQVTLMSIPVGGEIGLENHPNLDQFIRIEEGEGIVKMGDSKNNLDFQERVYDDFAFIIPANTWHNLVNTGDVPIKLYSIYAPPQHPFGTVHKTKADAEAAEDEERYNHIRKSSSRQPRKFTLSELAYYDGTMGKPAYVAVDGIVYDVSNSSRWREAMYRGLVVGRDITSQLKKYRGIDRKLDRFPKVGILTR